MDCEEQTRPWSAGHCDGHSNGQLANQPSQRRQSGQYIGKHVNVIMPSDVVCIGYNMQLIMRV